MPIEFTKADCYVDSGEEIESIVADALSNLIELFADRGSDVDFVNLLP